MSKVGKIAPVKQELTPENNTKNSLLKANRTRTPGTGVFKSPHKELSGKYRTGLDSTAAYIERITNKQEKEALIEKILDRKQRLETALGLEKDGLGPYSKFWNHALKSDMDLNHVSMYKLVDDINHFNFNDPWQELNFSWLSVHPTIASSFQAYQRGDFPDAQFYVVDEEVETKVAFDKKRKINKSIVLLDELSITKRKYVARQMGLPVTNDSSEEEVYKLIDDALKQTEMRTSEHRGLNPVNVFMEFAQMGNEMLEVKDLVKQLISHNILRFKEGRKLYRGDALINDTEAGFVKYLLSADGQEDRLSYDKLLREKQLLAVA